MVHTSLVREHGKQALSSLRVSVVLNERKEMYMRTDAEIRRDVESELQWDPSVDDKKIGVIVNNGVVTLTGEVSHFAGKWAAEDIAKRVSGVRAIANDLQVKIPLSG